MFESCKLLELYRVRIELKLKNNSNFQKLKNNSNFQKFEFHGLKILDSNFKLDSTFSELDSNLIKVDFLLNQVRFKLQS
jgi:hypothetical protein